MVVHTHKPHTHKSIQSNLRSRFRKTRNGDLHVDNSLEPPVCIEWEKM